MVLYDIDFGHNTPINCEGLHSYHDVVPLVELDGQVSVGLDPLGVGRVHDGLAGGTNCDGLRQFRFAGPGHPGHLRSEVGDVVLLFLQRRLRHEDGEVAVLHAKLFDLAIEKCLKKSKLFFFQFDN